ncbi:hypothetical protein SAMN04489713_112253 [Actinomadura madurae]|uniref:Uncharacterized protein n=1 Tax=Actinomadura madurae TaxID=1993 RepID=A0A1I5NQR8_9ACTN|nr:hypothetical protein [Actinomadura madurae]SFP24017.1 hypothetical protein SAMN04489713_112253 [Actinomadura madurae]
MGKFAYVVRASAAAIFAMGVSIPLAGVADAGQDARAQTAAAGRYPKGAGSMEFKAHGEHFILTDSSPDGAGVYVEAVAGDQILPDMVNTRGAGTSKDFNYSLPEGAVVTYRVCLIDNGNVLVNTCTAGQAVA